MDCTPEVRDLVVKLPRRMDMARAPWQPYFAFPFSKSKGAN
jgi:hypothetical protein